MLRSATHTVTATGNYRQTLANVKDRFSGSVAFSLYQKALPLSLSNCAFFSSFFASSSSFSPTTFHTNVSFGDTPVEGGDSKKNLVKRSSRLGWRNGAETVFHCQRRRQCVCVCVSACPASLGEYVLSFALTGVPHRGATNEQLKKKQQH